MAELRNTIDNLLREQRQVVLIADRSLNELNGLGSDLHARIAGGMTCGIETPGRPDASRFARTIAPSSPDRYQRRNRRIDRRVARWRRPSDLWCRFPTAD